MRRVVAVLSAGACVVGTAVAVSGPQAVAATAPGRVRGVTTSALTAHTLTLSWRTPAARSFARAQVRVARGPHAPRTVHEGHRLGSVRAERHTFGVGHLHSATTYSFSVFATDGHGHYGAPATTRVTTLLDAPRVPRSYAARRGTVVQWRNPASPALRRVIVRYARGPAAPTSVRGGTGARVDSATAHTVGLTALAPSTRYAVSIFAIDRAGRASAPAVTRFTTPAVAGPGPAPGVYRGTVVDSTGAPLVGADVFAYRYAEGDESSFDTTTDAGGGFELTLPPGEWTVGAWGPTALGGNSDATGYTYADGDTITVTSGRTQSGVRFALRPGAEVAGRVVDAAGHPLAGAIPYETLLSPYVRARTAVIEVISISYDLSGAPRTADDGTWTMRGVEPDEAFRLCADGGSARVAGSRSVTPYLTACLPRATALRAGTSTTVPDLVLSDAVGGVVSGRLTGAGGQALRGYVQLDSRSGDSGEATSDADGRFRIDGLPAGTYRLCATPFNTPGSGGGRTGQTPGCAKGVVRVTAGSATTADLALARGAAASGTVTGPDGRPLAGVDVDVSARSSASDAAGHTVTDEHGQWTVLGLPAGRYRACFDAYVPLRVPTGVLGSCWRARAPFALRVGRIRSGIDTRLAAGAAIAGTITDATGRPVPDASVQIGSDFGPDEADDAYAQTDSRGRYRLQGLTGGSYRVCFDTSEFDLSGRTGSRGCSPSRIRVRPGHTTRGVDLRARALTAIAVHVQDASGVPVAAVDATAVNPCGGDADPYADCDVVPMMGAASSATVRASVLTDGHGDAVLDGLSPGKHTVCLFAYWATTVSGGSPTGYADTCRDGAAYAITVVRGRTVEVTMTLGAGGSVSGRVTDTTGRAIAGARVIVPGSAAEDLPHSTYDDEYGDGDSGGDDYGDVGTDPDSPVSGSRTGADGRYSIIGVRPGTRTVCVRTYDLTGRLGGWLAQCVGGTPGTPTGGTGVTVTAGSDTAGTDVDIVPGADLSGRVTLGGRPVRDAGVIVFRGRSVREPVGSGDTDRSGRWSVPRLAAGTYTVCAYPGGRTNGQCWRGVTWPSSAKNPPLGKATVVTLAAGRYTGGIDLVVTKP